MRSFYRRIGSVQVRSAFVRPLGGVHVPTTEIRRIVLPLSSSPSKKEIKKKKEKRSRVGTLYNVVLPRIAQFNPSLRGRKQAT